MMVGYSSMMKSLDQPSPQDGTVLLVTLTDERLKQMASG